VPPHILFSDVSLRQMARDYPANERAWRDQRHEHPELQEFGRVILAVIAGTWKRSRADICGHFFEEPPRSWRAQDAAPTTMAALRRGLFERLRAVRRKLAEARACRLT